MTASVSRFPARTLPLLYLGTAHVSLGLACVLAGVWPHAVAGFFYHSWMVALVHLVTLGWITFSILGAIYIVGPIALGMAMPVRRGDYWAYGCAIVGLIGMVAHFWIQEFGGMAWSAATATAGILFVASRIVRGLRHAGLPAAVKLHLAFACLNIAIAASMGILIGFDKVHHFLPGFVLSNVFAHAHLAAIGWATMMVVGVAYRLLPMTLPSRMPAGRSLFASAILLEAGVLGLFVSLLFQSQWATACGGLVVAGLAAFAAHVVGMVRSPAARPPGAPRVDFAVLHAGGAAASLAAAASSASHCSSCRPLRPRFTSRPRTASSGWSAFSRRWSSEWKRDSCRSSRGTGHTSDRPFACRRPRRSRCATARCRRWCSRDGRLACRRSRPGCFSKRRRSSQPAPGRCSPPSRRPPSTTPAS